jgi:octaprenyl-diphosphate synthase
MKLSEISAPVKEHLEEFGPYFKDILDTKVSMLNLILRYVTSRKGKQIRPLLVFLSAQVSGGISKRSYVGAAMLELLHTATLIHDDVVDEASERRGIASINARWNNKIAVLIGDYLLSKGLITSVDHNEHRFLGITAGAVKRMSEGELLSIDKSKKIENDEENYFSIISDKTASLISACCEIGAVSATDDEEKQKAMAEFGENVGIAFQIRDDILDYVSRSSLIGKPVGNDIKEKKITLPLIHALEKTDDKAAERMKKQIKKGKLSKKEISEVVEFVRQSGGIEYSERVARQYSNEAITKLDLFPPSEAKESLVKFANFVVDRES